jgi:XTP/dITP diphosphohydrolase
LRIQFVTSNEGKYNEVRAEVARRGHELVWRMFLYPEVQTASLDEVVVEGLGWLRPRLGEDESFIIEDSGLFVTALHDFPGVFSAYVFKTIGNEGVLKLMEGLSSREARFESRIGLWSPGKGAHIFAGKCTGTIAPQSRGSIGFGYDPIFIPDGEQRTFAEMSREEKNSHSHRGRAVARFLEFIG